MNTPYRELCNWQNPDVLAEELINTWGEDGFIWLDGDNSQLGRWVTIAVDPIEYICCQGLPGDLKSSNPFEVLKELKPGHWTGWLSYEAAAWLEPDNPWKHDEMATLWIASHDPILKFDLLRHQLWLEGSNKQRFETFSKWINELSVSPQIRKKPIKIPIASWQWLTTTSDYAHNVKQIKKLIHDGDIFQANLAVCCSTNLPQEKSILSIYNQLRNYCRAPFSGLAIGNGEAKNQAVISVSPERFLKVLPNGFVETRPIKGTRPRNLDQKIDSDLAVELITSTKDRAENIMVVDLLRNDLSKVCLPGSINVSQLVSLESYSQVHHLTSVINGSLRSNKTWVDLLEACWPGGSITGAPKLRACQRLHELEKIARGPYCGSLINLNWNGAFDSNILIRSLMLNKSHLKAYAGCGIVADSDPNNEVQEMQWKLLPLLKALEK